MKKENIRIAIGMRRLKQGWTIGRVLDEWKKIRTKKVVELISYLRSI